MKQAKLFILPIAIITIISVIIGLFLGYFFWGRNSTYQGKTAKEWATMPTPKLISTRSFDVKKAIDAGYTYYDIVKYLSTDPAWRPANVPDKSPTPPVNNNAPPPSTPNQSMFNFDPSMTDAERQKFIENWMKAYNNPPTRTSHCTFDNAGGMDCYSY